VKLSENILTEIKKRVKAAEPAAKIILYGSYARGDAKKDSDIDLLILVNKDSLNFQDKNKIAYPLYEFAIETDHIISALVHTKKAWENKYFYTPLFHNIKREGVEL
jgi:uncharacterized protein